MNANAGLTHFIEFYLLLSMQYAASNRLRDNPFSRTAERFYQRVTEALNIFAAELARSVLDYIIIAGAGECRYADTSAKNLFIPELSRHHYSRSNAYDDAIIFDRYLLAEAMQNVFYDKWLTSAYGGRAWGNCIDAALDYMNHIYNDITFIDHAVDLEHNGGSLFNKSTDYFDLDHYHEFSHFLDNKFQSQDLAREYIESPDYRRTPITFTTAQLLEVYNTFILRQPYEIIRGRGQIEPRMFNHACFGDEIPTVLDKNNLPRGYIINHKYARCESCGNATRKSYLYRTWDNFKVCYDCIYTECEQCGNAICNDADTNYIGNQTLCPDCTQYATTCSNCGRYCRRDHQDWNGNYICYECYLKAPTCEECGYEIPDPDDITMTADDYQLCPDCTNNITYTCHACRGIFANYTKHAIINNREYCPECAKAELTICPNCGKIDYNHRTCHPIFGNTPICDECDKIAQDLAVYQMKLRFPRRDPTQDAELPQWLKDLT